MLTLNKSIKSLIVCTLMIFTNNVLQAQTAPTWWFGVSSAANMNFYTGTTQRLNNSLVAPTAFHNGNGVRPYGSVLLEYRPASVFGFMLNVGYDGRGGKFDDVIAPCNCPATLKTNLDYITVEPSLRFAVPTTNIYLFAGPRIAFGMQKEFNYTQLTQPNTDGDFSDMNSTIFSGQVGIGYEIPLSSAKSMTKVSLSPFISYHPYFGQDARDIESWSVSTVRAGIALKFGKAGKKVIIPDDETPLNDVTFSVREPKNIRTTRMVSETLPLLNAVFFNKGSVAIPERYVLLNKEDAKSFKESSLENAQSSGMNGRSSRQLYAYHNILNIIGDRMRANTSSSISVSGASENGAKEGKQFAETIQQYLVNTFGINPSRIAVEGRIKPVIPSEQPGGTKELALLREGDTRADITSTSPELLMEVGGSMMKPLQITSTQIDPLDSCVVLNVDGATKNLKSWSVDLTNDKGVVKHYGPFYKDQETIAGASVLGNDASGSYKVEMVGQTNDGRVLRKESKVNLIREQEGLEKSFRYSILFNFNQSDAVAAYRKFLTDIVSAKITSGATVRINGYTDIIGEEVYNQKLSADRAIETQNILEKAIALAGISNVKFETVGFGEDPNRTMFENSLPEERFYNRTVIIDIIPIK
ncbi:OmpA family protein [Pedobacter arcticus]|uniref:OmpA family protein n=1 Tax=Pedobacter arcticus TaxID=752140 RepID=UPI00047477F8|nr:OmpA family protein [Pedobacter arcticus]